MAARDTLPAEPGVEPEPRVEDDYRSSVRSKQSEVPTEAPPPSLEPDVFGLTDRGLVRANNQDQFLIAELSRNLVPVQSSLPAHSGAIETLQGRLFVVADGMGGYEGGDLASAIAVDTFASFVADIMPWVVATAPELREHIAETLRMGVHGADVAVHRAATELGLDERMGTTLTSVYVAWPEAYIVHVGDSRCYLRRDGEVTRLTTDHTVAQELLELQAINDEQANRTQLRHVLVNTVGGVREKQLLAEVQAIELCEGDELLLCTDGLTGHISDDELPSLWAAGDTAETRVRSLIKLAHQRGAYDNLTAILARF